MSRPVFLRIVEAVGREESYMRSGKYYTGLQGATSIQKCIVNAGMLSYGTTADEYTKLAESTVKKCLEHFVRGVRKAFTKEYLSRPNVRDLKRLLHDGERRGFPSMMGSIDCMHWEWKNYPRSWKGMYQGRSKTATVILEVVASGDLWLWHACFGTPGTCNDINMLHRSPVFDDIYQGKAPEVTYTVNGNTHNKGYYLTDRISPKWPVFMPAIWLPITPKDGLFTKRQESVRKDVERAFGVIKPCFAIIKRPALALNENLLWEIMITCIILHNKIVEDERDTYKNYNDNTIFLEENIEHDGASSSMVGLNSFTVEPGGYNNLSLDQYMERRNESWDRNVHNALQKDLVENLWQNRHKFSDEER